MSFENFTATPEKKYSQEIERLNLSMINALAEGSPEDRALLVDLKRLERNFFEQNQ
jgi:predicted phosphohydrolase